MSVHGSDKSFFPISSDQIYIIVPITSQLCKKEFLEQAEVYFLIL